MKVQHASYEPIWQQVLQDDIGALEAIYKGFYSDLFQYAYKLTADAGMAEDAVQDTFLYVWQHRQQIGVIKSLRFYLIRSVRNACLKLLQKRSKIEAIDANLQLTILPEELSLIDLDARTRKQLQQALLELSPRQREIIFLKFYSNLDYEEISSILDINYQSVVNHVHRAIQKLRKSSLAIFSILMKI